MPPRSDAQRLEALDKANEIRSKRARLKRDLKSGRVPVVGLLVSPPAFLASEKVSRLLLSVPKLGTVRMAKILTCCDVSASKTFGGLTERQRRALVTSLAGR